MHPITPSTLRMAAWAIQRALRTMDIIDVWAMVCAMHKYHEHWKFRFPTEFLAQFDVLKDVDLTKIQAELVLVNNDLPGKIHYHEDSDAFVICLGVAEHLSDPRQALALNRGRYWESVRAGDGIEIPKLTIHGFTTHQGGVLYFLSLQSPPISGEGYDDFVPI